MKKYFKHVNQWKVMFWLMFVNQIVLGVLRGHDVWDIILPCFTLWALYMVGYLSLDRELEINLTKAKEKIASQDYN